MTAPKMPGGTPEEAPQQVWNRPLVELGAQLRKLAPCVQGKWVVYLLPSGALVAARLTVEGIVIRVARRLKQPVNLTARAQWEHEVETFARHFKVEQWRRESESDRKDADGRDVLAMRFVQVATAHGPSGRGTA